MDGIINVLKPPGLTSRQVVSIVKGITKEKKVGHAGTLDPGACGVLPVMLGKATRLFDYIGEDSKEYIAEFTFGIRTTTQDAYGDVIETSKPNINTERVQKALESFVGECEQVPSVFSAIHINGKRAYDYAYEGREVSLPSRIVVIHEAELLEQTGEKSYLVRVSCSKGCYIRSLCEDVAEKLGTVGYVSVLIRTRTGKLTIKNGITIDELQEFKSEYVIPMETILNKLDVLHVPGAYDKALYNGNKLPVSLFETVEENKIYRIYDSKDVFWALGIKDRAVIRMKLMLRDNQ